MKHNSEPDVGQSPFRQGAAAGDAREFVPAVRAVGHSTRVADIIMLTVVVAVLLAIAVEHGGADAPEDRDRWGLMVGLIVAGSLAGLGATLFVLRNILASLYGVAVGAGVGAALPSLLWDGDATRAVMIGSSIMLAIGAVLGTLRRRGEAAARPSAGRYEER